MTDQPETPAETQRARWSLCIILSVWALLALVRLTGPSDLLDNDQLRPAMYTLDVVRHGRWIVQTDQTGDIASKPPMYVWAASIVSLARGAVDEWSLYIPTTLAMLGAALIASGLARRVFGERAALIAGIAMLCSPLGFKHLALARTDAFFCATVALAALLAWRAWNGAGAGRWVWFWLACAAATLTKGPLGVVIASSGLLAAWWGRRDAEDPDQRCSSGKMGIVLGAGLYVLICGGWLWLAYRSLGPAVIDKLIGKELVGHAARSIGGDLPFSEFYKPPLYFLSRALPWSIPAVIGVWRTLAHPAKDRTERSLERFLTCWLLGGLAIFAAAPHQRADLLLPLIPASAALAAREIDRFVRRWSERSVRTAIVIASIIALGLLYLDRHVLAHERDWVKRTATMRALAERLRPELSRTRLLDVDAPFGLQFYLGMHQKQSTPTDAREALRAREPVVIAGREAVEPLADEGAMETIDDPARPGAVMVRLVRVPARPPG